MNYLKKCQLVIYWNTNFAKNILQASKKAIVNHYSRRRILKFS